MNNTFEITELRLKNLLLHNCEVVYVSLVDLEKEEIEVKSHDASSDKDPIKAFYTDFKPVPLNQEWLASFGFEVDIWSTIKIKEYQTLSLGRTGSMNGLPYHPILREDIEQGFTIKQAYEIQVSRNDYNDKPFIMKRQAVSLPVIKYVHQLQNLLYVLMGKETIVII